MAPVVRPRDLVVVDYAADLAPGEIFVVQTEAGAIVLGHHVRKQQRDALHFSDPGLAPIALEKGRYRRLGRVREIRRDD
jgi:SOS-response transcriptional repressor LexA